MAKPSNDLSSWITENDYPVGTAAEGIAVYRLIVGTNGRVSECTIVRSSGNTELDDATCNLIAQRARFEAATDDSGAKAVGTFTGRVSWQNPE